MGHSVGVVLLGTLTYTINVFLPEHIIYSKLNHPAFFVFKERKTINTKVEALALLQ